MTKTKRAKLKAAKRAARAEAKRLLGRWREREPNPRAYMTEAGWLRYY
jgi:hypothetical protein